MERAASTPVVDAQVHVWLPEAPDRPWPPGGAERALAMHRHEPISGTTLLGEMKEAGVDRAVLVPPFFEGYRNDYAVACATEAPEAFRVMARVDLRTGDPGPVRELLRDPVVAGVRLVFLPADAGRVDDPAAGWLWSFA
jgi:L-fuconolactonase